MVRLTPEGHNRPADGRDARRDQRWQVEAADRTRTVGALGMALPFVPAVLYEGEFRARYLGRTTGWGPELREVTLDAIAVFRRSLRYACFGSKEGLFDAIFFGSLDRITNVVPIDATAQPRDADTTPLGADDLADWAVRLYDEYLRRPDLIRLAGEGQAAGLVRQGDPFDVMAMVITMSMTWSPVSNVYAATARETRGRARAAARPAARECAPRHGRRLSAHDRARARGAEGREPE